MYMQIQRQLQIRKQKGYEIAKQSKIVLNGQKWLVPSQSSSKKYEVILRLDKSVCTCLDFLERGIKCKHIFAVEIKLSKEINADGSITITKKITYPQNWALYNKGQIEEKSRFMELLSDLVNSVEESQGKAIRRPFMSIRDLLFASTLKVYTNFSLRRFMSDGPCKGKGICQLYALLYFCKAFYGKEEPNTNTERTHRIISTTS